MVRDAFRSAGTSEDRVNAIQGWEEGSGMQAHNGKEFKASTLVEEIKKVSYPGLDLSHLHCDGGKGVSRYCSPFSFESRKPKG